MHAYRLVLALCAGCPLLFAAACEAESGSPSSNAGVTDAGTDSSIETKPDASFEGFSPDITKVVATAKGGSPFPSNDASTCQSVDDTFTLIPQTRVLWWQACLPAAEATGVFARSDGQKTLTVAEYDSLESALRALKPSSENVCAADKAALTIGMTSSRGTITYLDGQDACSKAEGLYVDGMYSVFQELYKNAGSSHIDSPCTETSCDWTKQYCVTAPSDTTLEPTKHDCKPLPAECSAQPTCACLPQETLSNARCTDTDSRVIVTWMVP